VFPTGKGKTVKKTAIITGASRGIGNAIALQLGKDGFNIVLFATSPEASCNSLEKFKKERIDYRYVRGNLTLHEDRMRLVNEAVMHFGGIHVLVNNAGVAPLARADLLEMTEESFDRVIGINTKGNMFVTQAVVKQMLKQPVEDGKRGTIVNISSCSAEVSSPNRGEYCVSKAGVSMLTKLYADRLASESIFVHEVRPGVIATDMTSTVQAKYDDLIARGEFPIARWGTPEDVALVVSAFCSDKFKYTTGNYIDVDGGFHIRHL